TFEHRHVLAPLDLEGPSLVIPNRLEPRPRILEGPPDESRIAEHVGELRIRITGEFQESVEGAASEGLALGTRIVQQPEERLRIRPGRWSRNADSAPLGGVEQEGDRLISAGPRKEIE